MKRVNAQDIPADDRTDVTMKKLFGGLEHGKVTMGMAVFPPGARVPAVDAAAHSGDEYSYILKGTLLTMSGGQTQHLAAGEASFIPAGEAHWAYNDSDTDCELIWSLIEK